MKRRSTVIALAAASFVAAATLSGCGLLDSGAKDDSASAAGIPTPSGAAATPAETPAQPTPSGSAVSGLGAVKDSGDIPDPCTLLTKAQVTDLTGRAITQVDQDGASPGDVSRFCQWQQDSGQLALFVSRTTKEDFETVINGATPVDGVGQDAFQLAGHLYVLYGTVQIDVYSRGASDDQNLKDSIEVANVVIPKV
jgi:hypothetical protein